MKTVENSGLDSSDLYRGYSNTGDIPDEGDNVMKAEEAARNERKEERMEQKMRRHMGFDPESDVGGFLERNNTDDRY